jgi:hypothetical protein
MTAAHLQRPSLADVARAILGRKITPSDSWLVRGLLRLQERLRYGYMAEMDQPGRAETRERLEHYHRMAVKLAGLFGGDDMKTLAFLDVADGTTLLDVFATAKGLQQIAARLEREVQRLSDKSKDKRGGRGRAWATNGTSAKRECAAAVVAAYRKICESHAPPMRIPAVKVLDHKAGQLWYAAVGEPAKGWRDLVTWAASDDAAPTRKLMLRFFKGSAARSSRPRPVSLRYLTGNGA